MNQEQTLLNTSAAGDWLNEAVPGETPAHWRTALINNRRTDRSATHRVPFTTIGRCAFYTVEDLQAFAEFEKARRIGKMKLTHRAAEVVRAFGIGTAGGSSTGRKFKSPTVTPQVDEATGVTFLQLILDDPLMVYRIELDVARLFSKDLADAIGCLDRASGVEPYPDVTFETVTDNRDVHVERA